MKNLSLRARMILGGMLAVAIPLVVVSVAIFVNVSHSLEALTKEKATRVAQDLAELVQASLTGEFQGLSLLSVDPQIVTAARADLYGTEVETKIRRSFEKIRTNCEGLFIADRNGILRLDSVDGKWRGMDMSGREYFRKAREGMRGIGDPMVSEVSGEQIVMLAAPIFADGCFVGIVGAALKIDYLVEHISSIRLGKTGYSFMLKEDGIVIAHPRRKYILKTDATKVLGVEGIARRMLRQESGTEEYTVTGERKMAGFAPIGLTGWSVAVTQNRAEFMAPARTVFWNVLLFIPVALLFTLVIGLVTVRGITRPILALNVAAKKLAGGEWRQADDDGRSDELGEVVRSFNGMAAQLQELFVSLERSEEKYRGIFENAIEGIFQTSFSGQIVSANPALKRILGYAAEDDVSVIADLREQLYVDPRDRDEAMAQLLENERLTNFETRMYRKDGSPLWVSYSARLIRDAKGKPLHVEGLLSDITERKLAEEAMRRMNEELELRVRERTGQLESTNAELRQITRQLENAYRELTFAQSRVLQQEKMASIGQLAAGVAHEINNPIGFIISNLNSLRRYSDKITDFVALFFEALEKMPPEYDSGTPGLVERLLARKKSAKLDYIFEDLGNLIQESLDGADRVRKIVQNLKSFSRLDRAEVQLTDINEGLESTINIVGNELKRKAVLKREFGEIPKILCNGGQLNQAFLNILVNAAQAIEAHGEIVVRTEQQAAAVVVSIADTGKGIPADKLNRIFEPFFTTKDVGEGTGLGLSIAYDIVKKHDGEIRVSSTVGAGTTFSIHLPVAGDAEAPRR